MILFCQTIHFSFLSLQSIASAVANCRLDKGMKQTEHKKKQTTTRREQKFPTGSLNSCMKFSIRFNENVGFRMLS